MAEPLASGSAVALDAFDALLQVDTVATLAPAPSVSTQLTDAAHLSAPVVEGGSALWRFVQHWDLYRDPVLCGACAGIGLAALGVFVVLRRAVFVTAALSQAAGLGVALAFYAQIHLALNVSPVLGAMLASVATTGLLSSSPRLRLPREMLVAFLYIAASAGAVLVGDRIAQEAHDISSILFGSAVLVRPWDLALVVAVTALSVLLLFVLRRALLFTGFDPEGAKVQRLPVRLIEGALWFSLALNVSVSARALGSLPVFAFVVLPAGAALLLADRLSRVLLIAMTLGAVAGGVGYFLAFLADLPVGACQALIAAALALLAYVTARLTRR
jgi:zinc transport system permease protein